MPSRDRRIGFDLTSRDRQGADEPVSQPSNAHPALGRRDFFSRAADGLYGAALTYLFSRDLYGAQGPASHAHGAGQRTSYDLKPRAPHFPPRAKAVIHLCMQGGPSQVDLFDPKPALSRYDGKAVPEQLTEAAKFARDRVGKLMRSPWKFARHGESGTWVSELLPHLAGEVDQLAVIRSMFNVHPNHEPAVYKLQSGLTFPGHPTFGSWILYGLGTENQSLPAYVVLDDPQARLPVNGVENWQSGYLPPVYQGTRMRPTGSPLLNLRPEYQEPASVTAAKRDLLARLDRIHKRRRSHQPVLEARMRNYELSARMQLQAARALDLDEETQHTLKMYGVGAKQTDNFARRCLLARRLVERGVRFVQIYTKGQMWDNHRNLQQSLAAACGHTDQPTAALLRDLRQRGLLDSTLVLWGGEFGRLPMAQYQNSKKNAGRDHGPYGFTSWMAGAGVKPGTVYGSTDEIGYASVENRVSIQDWHATILHLLGLHHEDLFVNRNGLQEKLTHTFPTRIVHEVLA